MKDVLALNVGRTIKYTDTDDAGTYSHVGVVTDWTDTEVSLDVPKVGVLTFPMNLDKIELLELKRVAPKSAQKAKSKIKPKKAPVVKAVATEVVVEGAGPAANDPAVPAKAKRSYTRSETGRKLDQVVQIVKTSGLNGKKLLVHVMEAVNTTLSGANSFVYQARKVIKAEEAE